VKIDLELAAQIKAKLAETSMSQTTLARLAGLPSQSAVSNIIKGIRKVSVAEADTLRSILHLPSGPPVREVPLIGLASAGAWQQAIVMPSGSRFIPQRLAGARAFAVEVRGDSMDKLLPEGGWAVIDPDQTSLYVGRVYLIANGDEETTIKRYCGDPARFEPVSNNPEHRPFALANEPFRVIGRVVSYGNDGGL
jgi:SOS-response transcriptional repressor LexA